MEKVIRSKICNNSQKLWTEVFKVKYLKNDHLMNSELRKLIRKCVEKFQWS